MMDACSHGPGGQCQEAVVEAIDHARQAEGVGPLVLPTGYDACPFRASSWSSLTWRG